MKQMTFVLVLLGLAALACNAGAATPQVIMATQPPAVATPVPAVPVASDPLADLGLIRADYLNTDCPSEDCWTYRTADSSMLLRVYFEGNSIVGVGVAVNLNEGDAGHNGEIAGYAFGVLGVPADTIRAIADAGNPPQQGVTAGWAWATDIDFETGWMTIVTAPAGSGYSG